ncbi:MAG TPA: tetratricopeptide repeat protein [Drouetiella sp.]
MVKSKNNSTVLKSATTALLALMLLAGPALSNPTVAIAETPDSWDSLQTRGSQALYLAQYGVAERLLKAAVLKARAFGPGDLRLSKSEDELGKLLTIRGRFSEAEPLLEESLRVKEVAVGNADGQLIPTMGTLVRFYLTGGTKAKAEPLADKMLSFINGTLEAARPSFKMKPGQPLQGWAGVAATKVRDPLIEWAISCDDIADVFLAQKDYDEAEKLYKAALEVKTTVLGKDHLSLANSYDRLGNLCFQRKEYADAESYLRDSYEMTAKIQPPEHPQVYGRLDKLAKCYIAEGKLPEAQQLYEKAKATFQITPPKDGNAARTLFSLGNLYLEQKNYEAAEPVLEQALDMSEAYHGADSISLVPYMDRLAYDLYYLGRKKEYDDLHARMAEISAVDPTEAANAAANAAAATNAAQNSTMSTNANAAATSTSAPAANNAPAPMLTPKITAPAPTPIAH